MLYKIRTNYFSFTGRIKRKPYIVAVVIIFIIQFAFGFVVGATSDALFLKIILGLLILLSAISQLSFTTRRLHDLNKSGWVLFLIFIIVTFLWGASIHYRQLAGNTYLNLLQSKASVALAKQVTEQLLSTSQNLSIAGTIINILFFLYLAIKKGSIDKNKYDLKELENKEAIK